VLYWVPLTITALRDGPLQVESLNRREELQKRRRSEELEALAKEEAAMEDAMRAQWAQHGVKKLKEVRLISPSNFTTPGHSFRVLTIPAPTSYGLAGRRVRREGLARALLSR
jgi:hypothetical protein